MKKLHLGVDLAVRGLDELGQGGIKEVMSTEDTIHQPLSWNEQDARLFAIEASESQEAEPTGRLRRAERHQVVMQVASLASLLPGDSATISEWRQRMVTAEAKQIYKERAATAECVNAISRNRGLRQFLVRGLRKVRAVALWFAIAHNLMRAVVLRAEAALMGVRG